MTEPSAEAQQSIRALMYPRGYVGKYVLQPYLAWPRVARPYRCKSCGRTYEPALCDEVEFAGREQIMREITWEESELRWPTLFADEQFGSGKCYTHDRFNAYMWCREPGCSRYFNYDGEARGERVPYQRLKIRRAWLAMPKSANGADYRRRNRPKPDRA